MQVIQIYMQNALRNFNYIIYSEKSKEAIFVDPLDVEMTLPIAKSYGITPKFLINTHHHYDHIHDNEKFLQLTGAQHIILKNKEKFHLTDGEFIEAIDTPGHVHDHQCFIISSDHQQVGLISGDALFNAGAGNCKNGGDVNIHYESVYNIIGKLDGHLTLYPSHDYLLNNLEFALTLEKDNQKIKDLIQKRKSQNLNEEFIQTTLEIEKQINPFLRLNSPQMIKKFGETTSEKQRFIEIRKLRDKW